MSQDSMDAFRSYLSLDVFHGYSQIDGLVVGDLGTTDAAATLTGLLVDKEDGQDDVSKMLDNLAIRMTNA